MFDSLKCIENYVTIFSFLNITVKVTLVNSRKEIFKNKPFIALTSWRTKLLATDTRVIVIFVYSFIENVMIG